MRQMPSKTSPREQLYEYEVLDGLVPLCKCELERKFPHSISYCGASAPDRLTFSFLGPQTDLLQARIPVAAFKLIYFKVPRPQSLIQGKTKEIFQRELRALSALIHDAGFTSFRIGAAGSDSTVFQRIARFIQAETKLAHDQENGDLVLRFRRSVIKKFGWDVLIRLSPRPLSARSWRKENMPGALNACIAAAMLESVASCPPDALLNLMCGSGTLLAEGAALGDELKHSIKLVGVDNEQGALDKARLNLSSCGKNVALVREDCTKTSLTSQSFDAICADLPWGHRVGEISKLPELYAGTLKEAARLARPNATFALITQGIEALEQALQQQQSWKVERTLRVKQRDYKPKVYWLRKVA